MPVDNTAAEGKTTNAEAMKASAYNCAKGDDAPCVTLYDDAEGACCFMATVAMVAEGDASDAQTKAELAWSKKGWPTADGDSNTFCMTKVDIASYAAYTADDESAEWEMSSTSTSKYTGYCTSAVKIAAALSATAATVFATAF